MAIEEEPEPGIPEWVVTFGDMMSLLLTFFIMLVSMSEIKQEEKFQAMLESMRRQFGHAETVASILPGENQPKNSNMAMIASMGRSKRQDMMRGGNKVKSVSGEDKLVRTIRPGLNSTVGGLVFFGEDSVELDADGEAALEQIATQVAGKPQKIEIRGHSSRKPVVEGDHWDLAYRRCRIVMDRLVELGIDAERIRLGSAGSFEPIDTGINVRSRKMNARVEVLLWDEQVTGSGVEDDKKS
ncbi:Motility protein B [Pseudobythopirellula maris]|uniref:Motility protein B n=1 Tax=Pseudobythopirellula maris TaxID=2527991 RepID=A0A5C5ZI79_9BACT|nr:flagellar motor protein MotB [Pseudobythopirellula maris]TWT86511.1 Motility protein B [Pseudobythopirellula maris]